MAFLHFLSFFYHIASECGDILTKRLLQHQRLVSENNHYFSFFFGLGDWVLDLDRITFDDFFLELCFLAINSCVGGQDEARALEGLIFSDFVFHL